MCLAIYKPRGVVVPSEAYREGFRCNSHGAGFVTARGGKLRIHKGLFTFDDFWRAFEPHQDEQSLVHFRLATHGEKSTQNCHPFSVSAETAMIHNGILSIQCDLNAVMSDTWHYTNLVLSPMAKRDRDFFLHADVRFLGEQAIGRGNKFCFLRGDGEFGIWNEDQGYWEDDAWFSNQSHHLRHIGFPTSYYSWEDKRPWWQDTTPTLSDEPTFTETESEYYADLSPRYQLAFEDMLDDGFTVRDIDDIITHEGEEALLEYTNM